MSAKAKETVPEKAVERPAEKPAKKRPPKAAPPSSPAVVAPDGARLRRLARAGFEGSDLCELLDVELDVGPRALAWAVPVKLDDLVVCELGARIIASGVSPEALELAAARLRERG
jgi:hypothetical protein